MKKYNFRYYFKNYRFSSLFLKNFLTILLVLYLPLSLTCLGISLYFQGAWFDEVTSAAEGAVANVQEIVDTVQTNVMAAAINTASDTSVNRFVLTDEWDFPSYEVAQNIKGVMRDLVVSSGEYIDSIYVYSDRNGYLLSNSVSSSSATFFDMEWLPYCLEQSQSLSQWTWGRSGVSQLGVRQPYISTAGSVPYCRSYLDLELLRHGGEFSVEWDIDESLLDCFTVKLTLQPILENAIKYGLDNPDEPGKIRIRLFAREDAVVFAVEDNGRGADDARIAQMNESLGDVSPFIGTHNGVRNVHERIGLVFGSGYGLTFRRREWGGVAAFISIPKTMEAEKPAP